MSIRKLVSATGVFALILMAPARAAIADEVSIVVDEPDISWVNPEA